MTIFSECQGCGIVHSYHDKEGPTGGVIEVPGLCKVCAPKFYPQAVKVPALQYRRRVHAELMARV